MEYSVRFTFSTTEVKSRGGHGASIAVLRVVGLWSEFLQIRPTQAVSCSPCRPVLWREYASVPWALGSCGLTGKQNEYLQEHLAAMLGCTFLSDWLRMSASAWYSRRLSLEVMFFRWDVKSRPWPLVGISIPMALLKRVRVLTPVSWPNSSVDNYILPFLPCTLDSLFFTSCPSCM